MGCCGSKPKRPDSGGAHQKLEPADVSSSSHVSMGNDHVGKNVASGGAGANSNSAANAANSGGGGYNSNAAAARAPEPQSMNAQPHSPGGAYDNADPAAGAVPMDDAGFNAMKGLTMNLPQNQGAKGDIILEHPYPELRGRDITQVYILGKELGRGEFGVTCLATNIQTGELSACKSIPKRKLRTAIDIEDVRREVAIMHHLPPHPNIVGLKAVFEDRHAVHIVQELCEGGELFERIIARGHYSERQAAVLTRTIVGVVQICHRHGVMHRDLKPENFLFASKEEDSQLRAIDFGLSVMFKHGETFNEIVGSPYYMAPEVLRKNYGPLADVWSAGVILYILLCGVPPFWAETEQGVAQAVLRSKVDFDRDPWPKISEAAKSLVIMMLQPDPNKRPSAEQVLAHPWLRNANQAPDTPLGTVVLGRMKQFQASNQLKKKALKVIADSLDQDEVQGLLEVFKIIDADGDGHLTHEELMVGLRRIGSPLTDQEVTSLLQSADIDGDGTIDYQEWVAATMHMQRVNTEKNLRSAFEYFDADGSGYIDIEELADALGAEIDVLKEILAEVDTNQDGRISFEEFEVMMRKGDEWKTSMRHFSRERSSLRNLFKLGELDNLDYGVGYQGGGAR